MSVQFLFLLSLPSTTTPLVHTLQFTFYRFTVQELLVHGLVPRGGEYSSFFDFDREEALEIWITIDSFGSIGCCPMLLLLMMVLVVLAT